MSAICTLDMTAKSYNKPSSQNKTFRFKSKSFKHYMFVLERHELFWFYFCICFFFIGRWMFQCDMFPCESGYGQTIAKNLNVKPNEYYKDVREIYNSNQFVD